jgi:integrase
LQELEYFIINENKLLKKCPFIIRAIPESRMPGQRGRNTVNGYLKKFKSFVLWAKGEDLMTSNPFRRFKIAKDVYGTPYYISLEERHKIEQADLSSRPKLAIQRDIFVFHCCLGCRVGDLKRLTTANLINGEIHYIAQKTKAGNPKTIKIPLNETAMAIVEKYADPNRESLLPFISDQKYNYAIKEIFTLAGITRNVVVRNSVTGEQEIRPINEIASSHMARRTFVGNLFKKFKDQSLISELSGHVPNSREFARYREIDSELKREMVSVIE